MALVWRTLHWISHLLHVAVQKSIIITQSTILPNYQNITKQKNPRKRENSAARLKILHSAENTVVPRRDPSNQVHVSVATSALVAASLF